MKNICFLFFLAVVSLLVSDCGKHAKEIMVPPPQPVDFLGEWKETTLNLPLSDIWFTSTSLGFVATYEGDTGYLYTSSDSGKSWTYIAQTQSNGMMSLYFFNAQYGFGIGAQLQITTDGGNTWTLKSLPTINGLNLQFVSPTTGYYIDGYEGLFKTTDAGSHWAQVLKPATSTSAYTISFIDSLNGYAVDDLGNMYRTVDQGVSWQKVITNLPAEQPSFSELQFIDSLNGFYACSGGVFKTINGGTDWSNIFTITSQLNIIKFFGADTGYYKSDTAIFKTVNGGNNWTTSMKISGEELTGMHFLNPSTGWACTVKGHVMRLLP
jgi:photosystem II stability/assembly factor-like uncharacterized protein